ncbi:hypothetical protein I6I93_04595 [Peptoniphilus harei]|uniref:Signal transduction histidine kinase, nitrate /nitrite-specific n=1 Tax=Peptoniphilus harei TaxID=54005 RepID=A0A2X1XWB4_9FIRM|nr:hypothetical protein [Peptoniphilus harei]QQT90202.1 hypothetical protein I6I93_04595 [Peptoniphilus harei]SPY46929.1 Signal transduction histidine kinase, nitrate /nitrite-specific [Peptoniphilus harei]
MGKRVLKIIICQVALIFYWAWLYKVGDLIENQALMNLMSFLIIGIIYGFIHTEISKSEDKKSHGVFIFFSFIFFTLALNKNLSPIIFMGLGLVTSLVYIKKNLKPDRARHISILPVSRKMTQVAVLVLLFVFTGIIYLLDLDGPVIHIFYQIIFFAYCLLFFLFLKDREDVYEEVFKLFYMSDYLGEERENFARLIHDEVLQDIFAAKNYLSLRDPRVDLAGNILTNLNGRLREIMKFYQTRLFEDFGIEENIQGVFENLASLYPEKKTRIDEKISETLRGNASKEEVRLISTITKELVNNIYKHSEATYIFYRLYEDEDFIIMEVESDGMREEDFKNIEDSKRGVLLLKVLVTSKEGEISYKDRDGSLYTRIKIRRYRNENSFIR